MNIIFDGNFLFWKSYSVWSMYHTDRHSSPEENEQRIAKALQDREQQQVLLRKCIIDLCKAVNRFTCEKQSVTVVIDSHSWRYKYYSDYKYALTKVRGESYKDFLKVLDMFEKLLRDRGLVVSRVSGAEGDDLLYFWSMYYGELENTDTLIVTGDSDIRQLINDSISIFCNNSKNLKLFCTEVNKNRYEEALRNDREFQKGELPIIPTDPFEILLYKVVMGDTSDNIPKLKKGFGKVAFNKFISYLGSDRPDKDLPFIEEAEWILEKFCEYTNTPSSTIKEDYWQQIKFNLRMTWLNGEVYPPELVDNIIRDVQRHCHDYNYYKPYTLEEFYNLTIK